MSSSEASSLRARAALAARARANTPRRRQGYREAPESARCPAGEGIEILQEKWVLHIVNALLDGPKGFNAIAREVGGCNPTTLTQRLGRLERLGLMVKDAGDGNCRACYRLTEAGARLEEVIVAIHRWADVHLLSRRP